MGTLGKIVWYQLVKVGTQEPSGQQFLFGDNMPMEQGRSAQSSRIHNSKK